jgi:predicted phage terminase large subunit-like protein
VRRPGEIERLVKNVASHDGYTVTIKSQQDPGSAGKSEAEHFVRMLAGYHVLTETMPHDKLTRAKPVSAQCEVGNIRVLRAPWNQEFFKELENFPDGSHDDIVDVLSGAFNELCGDASILDVL